MPKTHFLWDDLTNTVDLELDQGGDRLVTYTNRPVLYGRSLGQLRGSEHRYFHYDGQGNTRALTDEHEGVTDSFTYSAFGEVVERTGSTETPYHFQGAHGYQSHGGTGPIYIRRRFYEPVIGRWKSIDPAGFIDGITRHLAPFVPNHADPSGLVTCSQGICTPGACVYWIRGATVDTRLYLYEQHRRMTGLPWNRREEIENERVYLGTSPKARGMCPLVAIALLSDMLGESAIDIDPKKIGGKIRRGEFAPDEDVFIGIGIEATMYGRYQVIKCPDDGMWRIEDWGEPEIIRFRRRRFDHFVFKTLGELKITGQDLVRYLHTGREEGALIELCRAVNAIAGAFSESNESITRVVEFKLRNRISQHLRRQGCKTVKQHPDNTAPETWVARFTRLELNDTMTLDELEETIDELRDEFEDANILNH